MCRILLFLMCAVCTWVQASLVMQEWHDGCDYSLAEMTSFRTMDEPFGAPALPEEVVLIDVPAGTSFESCTANVSEWIELPHSVQPKAIQRPRRGDSDAIAILPDPAFFGCDVWPEQPVMADGIVMLLGKRKLRLRVRPYRWRGAKQNHDCGGYIEAARNISVSIAFRSQQSVKTKSVRRTGAAQNMKSLLIISPPDLTEPWNYYATRRRMARPDWTINVIGTDMIYANHPFGVEMPCRTAAESIHAFIRAAAAYGTSHVLLGGVWTDASNTNRTFSLATGEAVTLSNSVPGICACPYTDDNCAAIPSDMFYACLDDNVSGMAYPWDPNGNGIYLEPDEFKSSDCMPDIAVGRFSPVPYAYGGGTVLSQAELITNYAHKVERAESFPESAAQRIGIVSGKLYTSVSASGTSMGRPRKELTFFDALPDTWSSLHPASVSDAAMQTREILRTVIATNWPLSDVKSLHVDQPLFGKQYSGLTAARNDFLKSDMCYVMCRTHGTATSVASSYITRNSYLTTATGLSLFNEFAQPCHAGQIDLAHVVQDGTYCLDPSLGVTAIASPSGGACAGIYNTSYGWIGEFAGTAVSDGYSATLGYETARSAFADRSATLGMAFLAARQKYVRDNGGSGVKMFTLCEQFFLGDPSLSLPVLNREGVVGGNVSGNVTLVNARFESDSGDEISGDGTLRVMNDFEISGTNLSVALSGGIGGRILFKPDSGESPGTLELCGDSEFYVGGVSDCASVCVTGSGKIIDVSAAGKTLREIVFDGSGMSASFNVLRCTTSDFFNGDTSLTVSSGTLRLETAMAFGCGDSVYAVVSNGVLVFATSAMRGWSDDVEILQSPLELHDSRIRIEGAKEVGWGGKSPLDLRISGVCEFDSERPVKLNGTNFITLAEGSVLSLGAPLSDSRAGTLVIRGCGRMVPEQSGTLCGCVRVTDGATLDLRELSQAVTSLVVECGATLRVPASQSGCYEVVRAPGVLSVEYGAHVYDLEGNPIEGSVVGGCFFERNSILRWRGGDGVWSDPQGWCDIVTGTPGAWRQGMAAVFDNAAGSCITNDMNELAVARLVFASDVCLCGNAMTIESDDLTVPADVTATIELPLKHYGDIVKFGDGMVVMHGLQDEIKSCGLRVAEGRMMFDDVTACGVTNLAVDAGTKLMLRGHSVFTNAFARSTIETNAILLYASAQLAGFSGDCI